jgi:dTMP kinase
VIDATGRLITLEGIEGAGKTCNLDWIQSQLESAGKVVLHSREPGGTPLGEDIRALLLGHRTEGMAAISELLLLFAARAEHLAQVIQPALARGEWVVCDRFTDASYAYQGGGRGLDRATIGQLERLVQAGLQPHLTLLLDVPVEVGLERAGRRSTLDRFERETVDFFQRVRANYRERAAAEPERIRLIDAALPLTQVQDAIHRIISDFLKVSR